MSSELINDLLFLFDFSISQCHDYLIYLKKLKHQNFDSKIPMMWASQFKNNFTWNYTIIHALIRWNFSYLIFMEDQIPNHSNLWNYLNMVKVSEARKNQFPLWLWFPRWYLFKEQAMNKIKEEKWIFVSKRKKYLFIKNFDFRNNLRKICLRLFRITITKFDFIS